MIEFFDTTVLVAAMVEDEPHHPVCAQALEDAKNGCASIHSLAECYATLTGGAIVSRRIGVTSRHSTYSRAWWFWMEAVAYAEPCEPSALADGISSAGRGNERGVICRQNWDRQHFCRLLTERVEWYRLRPSMAEQKQFTSAPIVECRDVTLYLKGIPYEKVLVGVDRRLAS
jgi:hypothetical protein